MKIEYDIKDPYVKLFDLYPGQIFFELTAKAFFIKTKEVGSLPDTVICVNLDNGAVCGLNALKDVLPTPGKFVPLS